MEGNSQNSALQRWKSRQQQATAKKEKPAAIAPAIPVPTRDQKRLWILQNLYPGSSFYNYVTLLKFKGNLDVGALEKSLELILEKQDVLRTSYPGKDGVPELVLHKDVDLPLTRVDLRGFDASERDKRRESLFRERGNHRFALDKPPLFSCTLVRLEDAVYELLLAFHHIIIDEWSIRIFKEDLAAYYKEFRAGQTPATSSGTTSFTAYAAQAGKGEQYQDQIPFWKKFLAGDIPSLQLGDAEASLSETQFAGKHQKFALSQELSTRALQLAKDLKITPFVLFLGVHNLLLSRYAMEEDIAVGTPISTRNSKELDRVMGFFLNSLVLRSTVQPDLTFREYIMDLNADWFRVLGHKDVPLEVLVKEVNPTRAYQDNPFFNSMFLYFEKPEEPPFGEDLELTCSEDYTLDYSKFDITFGFEEDQGVISSLIEYSTAKFSPEAIDAIQKHLVMILSQVVDTPEIIIGSIPLLSPKEIQAVLEEPAGQKLPFADYQGIHEVILEIAKHHPDKVAVQFGDEKMTYRELILEAGKVAFHLQIEKHQGIVGLCMENSCNMIAGMLGILLSGHAYLPLDPGYPDERLQFMVGDAQIKKIVTQSDLAPKLAALGIEPLIIEDLQATNTPPSLVSVGREDYAYMIYTSGSTGQPKGVPVTHGNILDSTAGRLDFYPENPSAFLLLSSISFDSSKAGIFWTLTTGGTLVLAPKRIEQDPLQLGKILQEASISHTLMLPSLYKVLLEVCPPNTFDQLQGVVVAGEACPAELVQKHFTELNNTGLYNEYGPTEATVWCIAHNVSPADTQVPIGKPVAGARIFLLDKNQNLVPQGAVGEIYIGGPGLTPGYLKPPKSSSDPFREVALHPEYTVRLYKTGDLAKLGADGNYYYLGRADEQVKIRGFRVELGEIEERLRAVDAIDQAHVLWDKSENKLRAAYTVKATISFGEIKRILAGSLPGYMIPNQLVQVERIPTLPNGKSDRNALLQLLRDHTGPQAEKSEEPVDGTAAVLRDIWKRLLGVAHVGLDDNYFDLGGDSIKSIQLIAAIRKQGFTIHPAQVFNYPTIRELSLFLEKAEATSIEEKSDANWELLPIQQWFFETHQKAPHFWNMGVEVHGLGNIDPGKLNTAIRYLMERHPGLSSGFHKSEASWTIQSREIPKDSVIVAAMETTVQSEQQRFIQEVLLREQAGFDLTDGPLFKAFYFMPPQGNPRIFLVAHHLLLDVVSWQILQEDFELALSHEEGTPVNKATDTPYSWMQELKEHFSSALPSGNLDFWKRQQRHPAVWPGDQKTPAYSEEQASQVEGRIVLFDTENTWSEVNRAYGTKTDEVLLTALLRATQKVTHRNGLSLWLERTGRPQEAFHSDFSSIVGWLTSFFPITLKLPDSDQSPENCLPYVKEQLRKIPNQGLGYGLLRYGMESTMEEELLAFHPQLVFNYTGEVQAGKNTNGIVFEGFVENLRHPQSERQHNLEMNSWMEGNVLVYKLSYNPAVLTADDVRNLLRDYEQELQAITEHCSLVSERHFTPSDFPMTGLDQNDLVQIQQQVKGSSATGISNILPLTEIQHALLIHRRTSKEDEGLLPMRFRITGKLNADVFAQALQSLVQRHEVLRSSVRFEGLSQPAWVIHESAAVKITRNEVPTNTSFEGYFEKLWEEIAGSFDLQEVPLTQLHIVQTAPEEHWIVWPVHHILLDGWSSTNLLTELVLSYDQLLVGKPIVLPGIPALQTIYKHSESIDAIARDTFWTDYFRNFSKERAVYPARYRLGPPQQREFRLSVAETQGFLEHAKVLQVSPNTVFRALWAILEASLTGNSDSCFGATVSGRANGLPGMEQAVGMFTNVLPVRISIAEDTPFKTWLGEIQQRDMAALEYEQTPNSYFEKYFENKSWSQAVESLLIFESHPWDTPASNTISIDQFKSGATTNYPLNLIVVPGREIQISLISHEPEDSPIPNWLGENLMVLIREFISELPQTASGLSEVLSPVDFELPSASKTAVGSDNGGYNERSPGKQPSNPEETALQQIWDELLGTEKIGVREDFFNAGGTSLDVIHLFARIEKEIGIKLPPTTILFHPTIEDLASNLVHQEDTGVAEPTSLVPLRTVGTKAPLFCVHGGEGHILFYRELSKYLDPDRPIYLLQPKGVNGETDQHESLEEMASDYLREINEVYDGEEVNLVYYCYSALAIEMAQQLKKKDRSPNLIIIDSTALAPSLAASYTDNRRSVEYLKRLKRFPLITIKSSVIYRYRRHLEPLVLKIFNQRETLQLRKIRENLHNLFLKYQWKIVRNKATLILIREEHPDLIEEKIERWTHWLGQEPEVVYNSGNHFSIFEEPHVALLGQHIESACSQ
ncbi:non-ribosomal peptide synthase domain TIGR01720/amino acid adenylation domain-containing protein [Robiginitalea myxolifaciens]|uniref:Non-ribosomal peptide synthase domain TIGR01720/amino acid adenylation domain-containing protein n=1 Tax=Robiginitalea myxolifaciens TaxID=400055 RepID=A0A1I6FXV1_9FLAO|nr:non-ribosomal peptide synthetase [Robiginitalea myxolifaciens]SFR34746.1 non-ribosomal peptide synthase domain TIGR01720/amino acid adenylation domain-containing protein [Robiginitalea myxolifaciens]